MPAAVVGALVAIGAPSAAGLAQEAPSQEPERTTVTLPIAKVDSSGYPAVTITVTVPGELAEDSFELSDFFVSENNEARSVFVQAVDREDLAVVLVLDTSGSMEGAPLAEARSAITSFVEAMPDGVTFALVRFGTVSELVVPFTTDRPSITDAVADLTADGETALYDALRDASDVFTSGVADHRTLILLSDGGDTASSTTLEQSIAGLVESETDFVAVPLSSPENDPAALQRLSEATQGSVVPASDPAALTGIFGDLASDLLNQFRITFAAQHSGLVDLTVALRGATVVGVAATTAQFPEAPAPTVAPPTSAAAVPTSEPPVAAAPPVETIAVPWYQSAPALPVGAVVLFLGLFGLLALGRPERASAGVAALRTIAPPRRPRGVLSGVATRASAFAEAALVRSGGATGIRLLLDQAGLNLRVGEFVLVALAAAAVGALLGNLWLGTVGLVVGVSAGSLLSLVVVSAIASVRARRFREQLPDTLQLVAGALRAGFGLNQAIDSVVVEAPDPTAGEFDRVRLEVQLGRDLEDALDTVADRVRNDDLRLAAEAVEIHRQVGGDLAELLERVAATVRERENIRRQIQVLSAEGRLSAIVLIALPLVIGVIVRAIAPDYLAELTTSGVGRGLIGAGIVLLVTGIFWIRRIVRLEY